MLFGTRKPSSIWGGAGRPADAPPPARDFAAARIAYRPPVVSAFAAASSAGAGSNRPAFRNLALALAAARSNEIFEVAGRVVWFHEWTALSQVITLRFNDANSDPVTIRPGKALTGIAFERLLISHDAIGGSCELLILPDVPDSLLTAGAR